MSTWLERHGKERYDKKQAKLEAEAKAKAKAANKHSTSSTNQQLTSSQPTSLTYQFNLSETVAKSNQQSRDMELDGRQPPIDNPNPNPNHNPRISAGLWFNALPAPGFFLFSKISILSYSVVYKLCTMFTNCYLYKQSV